MNTLTRFTVAQILERAGLEPWSPDNPDGWLVWDHHSVWRVRIKTGEPAQVLKALHQSGIRMITKTVNDEMWVTVQ